MDYMTILEIIVKIVAVIVTGYIIPKLTIKVPAIAVRGHATYFKPDNAGGIDGDGSTFSITIELWRADVGTGYYQGYYGLSLDAINP